MSTTSICVASAFAAAPGLERPPSVSSRRRDETSFPARGADWHLKESLQAFGALAYAFVRDLTAFYAVAAVFGFIYAGTMPLHAVITRENFPLRMMGTVIGGTAMASNLGMATGPLAGGLIYDSFGSYMWLYVGAWGIGAFLIGLTFRPMVKEQAEVARAV